MTQKTALMTIHLQQATSSCTFTQQKLIQMQIIAYNPNEMKLLKFISSTKLNPWIGILVSLLILVPSLYQILDDVTILRKEYLFLAVSFPLYIVSLKNLFDTMLQSPNDFS